MTWAIILFLIGLFLSALFSGTETGFYRANRIRLAMDMIEGDRLARYLLLMGNQPGLFVASTLIGNNLANYLTSMSIVIFARVLISSDMAIVELIAPILFAPILFVYGELLPKQLYFRAPNRMLRFGAPVFLVFSFLFLPVSIILWALSRILQFFVGQSPETMRAAVARKELKRILQEGKEAGVLETYQQRLTEQFFAVANRPISEACKPLDQWPYVPTEASLRDIRDAMMNKDNSLVLITDAEQSNWGYLASQSLLACKSDDEIPPPETIPSVPEKMPQAKAILLMQASDCQVLRVSDKQQSTVGFVSFDELTESIFASAVVSKPTEKEIK